jgi:hypothetical protein
MRFGFWFDYDQTYTFVGLFKEFAKRSPDSRVSGFVINDRYFSHAAENLPPDATLIRLYDLVAEGRRHVPDLAALADFRAMDERHRLSRVAYADRHLRHWRYDQLIRMYVYLIDAFRKYIDLEKPDVFIFNVVASQYAYLLYLILVEKGVKVVIPLQVGVDDLFYLTDSPYQDYDRGAALFQAMQAGRDRPSAEERVWAEQFIDRIRRGSDAYSSSAVTLEQRKFVMPGPSNLLRIAAYLKNYFLYDRFDPTLPNPWRRLKTIFQLRRNRAKTLRYFKNIDDIGKDFVIYLLHYEPEVATLILSQYEQKSFIDIIVRQLPLSTRLVVKEHPVMVGQRHWTFYDELTRRYPNLVLVDPGVSTNHLIQRARAVVTLSGTVVIEAFALRQPVIFASRARFGGFGLGSFLGEIQNFGSVLATSRERVPSEADVVNMLSALHRTCFRCKFAEPLGDPGVLEQENIEKIATAILGQLKAA